MNKLPLLLLALPLLAAPQAIGVNPADSTCNPTSINNLTGATPTSTINWMTVSPASGNPVNFFGTQSGTLQNPGDSTRNDFVTMIGWNANGGGGPANTAYPGLFDSWEDYWCPGVGQDCYMERHVEFWNPTSAMQYRPITIQMDINTPGIINSGLMFSNLNFTATDGTQRLQFILPEPSGVGNAVMNMIDNFVIQWNTNNVNGLQMRNAGNTAFISLIFADSNNLVQIGSQNAAGINLDAPLQGTTLANDAGLSWKDSGGTAREVLYMDNANDVYLTNNATGGQTILLPATGKQMRFENHAQTAYIMDLFESTQDTTFGGNNDENYKVDIEKSGSTGTFKVKDQTATTGFTRVLFDLGAKDTNSTVLFTLNGEMKFGGLNTTGSGSAALGANSPAITNSAPYTWIAVQTSDGSTAYIPAWK